MSEQPVWFTRRRPPQTKELDAEDPYQLTGVRYPVAPGVDADHETARTLAEEFALQGWSREAIARLFADPHAGHANEIFQRRGRGLLDVVFDEVFGPTERAE